MSINVITEDRASGAQVIDGSLKFDGGYLTRTPTSVGNRRTFTWSAWIKRSDLASRSAVWGAGTTNLSNNPGGSMYFDSSTGTFRVVTGGGTVFNHATSGNHRDTGWYHIVVAVNTAGTPRVAIYINGERATASGTIASENFETDYNNTIIHAIGTRTDDGSLPASIFNGYMSQVYLIDGQALGPEYFGFTDGLTNTWRPKKYVNTTASPGDAAGVVGFGTNGFYLPMDGNSPIGQDKSGQGNDWTPVNFGGSVALDKATGALPIMNTTNGGNGVGVGVRTDAFANNLVLALPLVGDDNDVSNQINSGSTTKTVTTSGAIGVNTESNFYDGSFSFNIQADYITLDGSSDFAFGTGDFTIESWVYPTGGFNFYDSRPTNTQGIYPHWEFRNGTDFRWRVDDTDRISENGAIKLNAWSHVAVVRNSGTTQLYVNGVATGSSYSDSNNYLNGSGRPSLSGGYEVNYAVTGYRQDFRVYKGVAKYTSNFIPAATNPGIVPDTPSGVSGKSNLTKSFNDGSVEGGGTTSDYLQVSATGHSDFSIDGDFTVEWFMYRPTTGNTYMWTVGDSKTSTGLELYWGSSGTILKLYSNDGGSNLSADAIIGWSHYAVVRSGSTITVYYNGTSVGTASNSNTFSGNFTFGEFYNGGVTGGLIGPISNFRYVKGTAVYTSNFTPPTEPLTAITNTKLLCFRSNSSATEAVVKPANITSNGTITLKGSNPFNTDINAIRGQESSYCTLNPLRTNEGTITLSDGNLKASRTDTSEGRVAGTMRLSTGKFYFEVQRSRNSLIGNYFAVGVTSLENMATTQYSGNPTSSGGSSLEWVLTDRATAVNDSTYTDLNSTLGNVVAGDVVQVCIDMDASKIWFGKNGIFSGTPQSGSGEAFSNLSSEITPLCYIYNTDLLWNFGQKPFKFPPPDGFQPLCLYNLPRPTKAAVRPDKYFGAVIYDGDGGSSNTVTGLSFKPDLVWGKCRTGDTLPHNIFDVVRGFDKQLDVNDTATEVDRAGDAVTPLSNGFILDATYCNINNGSTTNVAWCWKRSIESGFDIVTHTNTSDSTVINHNLGKTPEFIITKCRTANTTQWRAHHVSGGVSQTLILSTQEGYVSSAERVTAVSDTTFTYNATVSANGNDFIHYVWTSVPGFSKFGSYTGNGNADGPFVHCGFKPAWVMVRRTDSTSENWYINDSTRDPVNVTGSSLMANQDRVEATTGASFSATWDILSNGFKLRDSGTGSNTSGVEYAFMAFAEAPEFNLYGAQTNAR